jgi:hypothetical protein
MNRQPRPATRLTQKPEVSEKTMWKHGPVRRWSLSKTTFTPMGYAEGGFVGSYVCAGCWEPCDGLYLAREEQKWLCGPCQKTVKPLDTGCESTKPVQQRNDDPVREGAR